jgi:hypothetical protein
MYYRCTQYLWRTWLKLAIKLLRTVMHVRTLSGDHKTHRIFNLPMLFHQRRSYASHADDAGGRLIVKHILDG